MNVMEVCQRRVVTVRRHEEVSTAAWVMRERNVGCLVVVEPMGVLGGNRPVGVIADRDIVTKVIVQNADPRTLRVDDVMSRNPVIVGMNSTIEEALSLMRVGRVRRAPIVDDRGRLVGILALDDIYEHYGTRAQNPVTPMRRESPVHGREQDFAS